MSVEIRVLGPAEQPPADRSPIVLVRRISTKDPNWRIPETSGNILHHPGGVTFLAPSPVEGDLEVVVEQARSYAERHGINAIYVKDETG